MGIVTVAGKKMLVVPDCLITLHCLLMIILVYLIWHKLCVRIIAIKIHLVLLESLPIP